MQFSHVEMAEMEAVEKSRKDKLPVYKTGVGGSRPSSPAKEIHNIFRTITNTLCGVAAANFTKTGMW
jgi:hypothetical protein